MGWWGRLKIPKDAALKGEWIESSRLWIRLVLALATLV